MKLNHWYWTSKCMMPTDHIRWHSLNVNTDAAKQRMMPLPTADQNSDVSLFRFISIIVSATLQVTLQRLMGGAVVKAEQSHSLNTKRLRVPCMCLTGNPLQNSPTFSQANTCSARTEKLLKVRVEWILFFFFFKWQKCYFLSLILIHKKTFCKLQRKLVLWLVQMSRSEPSPLRCLALKENSFRSSWSSRQYDLCVCVGIYTRLLMSTMLIQFHNFHSQD